MSDNTEINEFSDAVDAGQENQLEHYFQEVDAEAVEALSERYGNIAAPERIAAMAELPSSFESQEAIDRGLNLDPDGESGVLGYSQGIESPAHISTDQLEVPATLYHERMHQLADPTSREVLGSALDEGVTEALALDTLGVSEADLLQPAYIQELGAARGIMTACGSESVERAYFQGNGEGLNACLNETFGEGTLDRLRENVATWDDLEPRR